ncbi:glycosyltransferase family 2 protein [Enteractinococcus helveticum]|uniref:glycosyltransferase family 2 protein n=1 Tax=Enteractinococcus helveticum TaxID=1837282 RepID=UPI0012374BE4|nr:glycosyltransferase family 2 protein [Enteractinococcus helveticum]
MFYRFALQTRSIEIRDFFAKSASDHALDLSDLLAVIENEVVDQGFDARREFLAKTFDSAILLTLADLIANTARDELDTFSAVKIYDFVFALHDGDEFSDQNKLQYVEALNELEFYDQARELAKGFDLNDLAPFQQDLLELHRIRRTAKSPLTWLEKLNEFYSQLGMSQVSLLDNESLSLLDRLTAAGSRQITGPKISVIMPTFSPGPGIRTAIRSLLDQSWMNFEVIVVNDSSPAEYRSIFDELERIDTRIRIVHQNENTGAYVARNAGLAMATGDFITTHDDDDWSHPDKLAMQIQVMLEDNEVVATTSAHIRTTAEADFRRINMRAQFMQMNYSSLMFRRSVVEEIGPWDTVNRGGDSEFYTRLIEYYGNDRVTNLNDQPLSFSRIWEGSLTSGEMSRGYFSYSRLLYRWSFRQWHWSAGKSGQKAIRTAGDERPYAVPTTFEAGQRNRSLGQFDVIYVTDFFRQAKYVDRALEEIATLSEVGLRVGYMHLYSPETSTPAGIPPRLFELQVEGKVTQVGNEDQANTELLVLHDLAIGMFLDQLNSKVEPKRSVVVDHMQPILSGSELRTPVIYAMALKNLDRFFNTRFELTGGSKEKYLELQNRVQHFRLLSDNLIWHTHIAGEPEEIILPERKPIVGFHSYGNQYRWPNNAKSFRSIYSSESFSTKLFGQLEPAFKKFGNESFAEIEVVTPDDLSEAEFLKSIDFWVYFPHYRLEDQVWEPVLTAMQAGKVVILPKRLERLYGGAAVYADVEDLSGTISRMSNNTEMYRKQAQAGQTFVKQCFTRGVFLNRIHELM